MQSVAALVLVIMAEMATTAFIFIAHDKASNRNKNKTFDHDLKLLCEIANFCVQPILMVITGSFLCLSIVLQVNVESSIRVKMSLSNRNRFHRSVP